jgi:hypothetical protein
MSIFEGNLYTGSEDCTIRCWDVSSKIWQGHVTNIVEPRSLLRLCMRVICNNSKMYINQMERLPTELSEKLQQSINLLLDCNVYSDNKEPSHN